MEQVSHNATVLRGMLIFKAFINKSHFGKGHYAEAILEKPQCSTALLRRATCFKDAKHFGIQPCTVS